MLFLELVIQGLIQGSTYAIIAVGLTLVYGLLRVLHVAHAGLFTLGAYLGVLVTNHTGSLGIGVAVAAMGAALAGILIYRLVYEPHSGPPALRGADCIHRPVHGHGGALSPDLRTLRHDLRHSATAECDPSGRHPSANLPDRHGGHQPCAAGHPCLGGPGNEGWHGLAGHGGRSQDGRLLRHRSIRVRYLVFGMGSALAAVAGVLVALLSNLVEPTMGAVPSYKSLAIIVLGGLGNVGGTLIASLILGVVEAFGTIYLGSLLDRDAIAFAFLVVVLMIRPTGLFTSR